ncbi:MAG: PDDEXK nuclease domain-containing protein [Taibaiella sp.]|jgi:predicted nuclease of restriction endonuclease-like (RecB) superfamily
MQSISPEYKIWLGELKLKIRSVQLKAAVAVNSALIGFYWELGKMISEKDRVWGSRFLEQVSQDLKTEFPEMQGFSVTNLKYCKLFYNYFSIRPQVGDELKSMKSPQLGDESGREKVTDIPPLDLVTKIPWGHIKELISKVKDIKEAQFYIEQTIAGHWSRDVLALQIKSGLYQRQGKAINNFKETLPDPMSDLAQQTLKDPYVFDFMTMSAPFKEKDIEDQLIEHITKFLLELGKGFAFIGRQYHLEIADNDYYLDLLFYHTRLKCYVVIELKNTKFIPEYAGKLNFYLSAVDSMVKQGDDNPTIGILLCRDKNNIEAEFALRDINKPMGVSEFEITEHLPENLKNSLPTIEELENELKVD